MIWMILEDWNSRHEFAYKINVFGWNISLFFFDTLFHIMLVYVTSRHCEKIRSILRQTNVQRIK